MAPPADTHTARRPLTTVWRRPRISKYRRYSFDPASFPAGASVRLDGARTHGRNH